MTRKDYVLIAEALKRARTPYAMHTSQANADAEAVADALAADNPRFDRERFLRAAGVTP